jgi:rhamnose transport system permease protein
VITAVVLGGVNIFGGRGTMAGVLVAVLVLAFVQNALGLAGVTPEEQQIVTGAVLVVTLVIFSSSDMVRKARNMVARFHTLAPQRRDGGAGKSAAN